MGRLATSGLGVSIGGKPILRDVTLDFDDGLIHGVLGPNGSGKTTLIRALSGAQPVSAGRVTLDGRCVGRYSAAALARELAVVWQAPVVSGDLTVRRLVGYGRYAHLPWWRLNPPADDAPVETALARTGMTAFAQRRLDSLSGGERQRAWLATALAQEPTILLLDEPTTYLDIAHQIDMLELIRGLNRTDQITVIAVLHDLTQAARYCDRCVVLRDGMVAASGTPVEALRQDRLREHFDVDAWVTTDSGAGLPVISPRRRATVAARSAE